MGDFQYEPKRALSLLVKVVRVMMVQEQNSNIWATFGPVKGWEYLIKWSEGRQWGNEYEIRYWLRYIGDWLMVKLGWTELGLEDISYVHGDLECIGHLKFLTINYILV